MTSIIQHRDGRAYDEAPPISRELVEWLENVYPDKLPTDIEISDRALGVLFGHQQVLQLLRGRLAEQEETIV